jgi:hypothetical protein
MRYLVFGVCVFAAACGGEVQGGPMSPSSAIGGAAVTEAKRGSGLPFRGTLEASETENGALHHLVGTGNATLLGRFTLTSDFIVNAATVTASGTATWTGANGEQIFTTHTGQGVVTFPLLATVETQTITGGTGRFADASGAIVLERSINLLTLISSASITGTINLGH